MYDINRLSGAADEPNPESRTLGLIGAMIDGMLTEFEYRDFTVHTDDDDPRWWLVTEEGEVISEMWVVGAPLNGILEWLQIHDEERGEE